MIERQYMGFRECTEKTEIFRLLKSGTRACDVRVRGCFIDGVHIRKLL